MRTEEVDYILSEYNLPAKYNLSYTFLNGDDPKNRSAGHWIRRYMRYALL